MLLLLWQRGWGCQQIVLRFGASVVALEEWVPKVPDLVEFLGCL